MKGLRTIITAILCILAVSTIQAQPGTGLSARVKTFGERLDSAAVKKFDARYIDVPDRPWRIILRSKFDETTTGFTNRKFFDYEEDSYSTLLQMDLDSKLNKSVGLWVGYRGLGIGYYYKLNKKPGINISISATGARYGMNIRLRSQKYEDLHARMDYLDPDTTVFDYDTQFWTPIDVVSLYFNAYYVFNGRRYSQAAAYNQAVIQKKSAGSLLLGATAYASGINMAYKDNASLIYFCDSVGTITLGKITLGLGYGYNWVPARGWTVNAMVMPNISLSDKVTRVKYDCNYSMFSGETRNDYGKWDSEKHVWENGEIHKIIGNDEELTEIPDDIDIWECCTESRRTSLSFNLDLRMGVAYCWKRYFVSANVIFNHFEYGGSSNKVDLIDWYATASLGIRL